jgi:tetratricopeptide (TPR) repeat protein
MSRRVVVRLLLTCSLLAAGVTGCSRDPNVRKQKFFESGEKYFAEGKYREAAIQYRNATQIDPRFAQAHYQLGQAYLKVGDRSAAAQEFTTTVELAPNNYDAHAYLADLLTSWRAPDGSPSQDYLKVARQHLDLIRDKQPNSPETHAAWAMYDAAQNNVAAAMQEMQQAINAEPRRSDFYLSMASFQLRANLPDRSEASFKKAIEVDPKDINAQSNLGSFYQLVNRLPEAEQQFKHAIDVAPKDPGPRALLVHLLVLENRKGEAESFLRQTKKDLSDNPDGYRMLGEYYIETGDVDKATTEFSSLNSDHPKDLLVKRNYIQLLILKNRLDEAAKLNNEILKASPNDALALVYKGQIQLRQNDPSGAIDSLHNALKNNPDDADAHYWMGNAFAQQHNERQAESEWREAVKIRPNMAQALSALATLESNRGDADAVLQIASQLIAAQPDSADGFVLKGVAERARQKYSDSEQDLLKAANLAPQSPIPYVQLGNLREAQKQYPEAIKFYQQAFDRDAASTDALQGIMNSYLAEKQPDLAIEAAKAQIAKSNTSGFYDLLGTALSQNKKDLQGAEAAFRKAVELDQSNGDALLKLGQVEVAKGFINQTKDSMDQTLAMYQDHIKKNPRDFAFYILAGEMYASQGNWDQAKTMYQQALTISPDEPKACNNLAYGILEHGGNVDVALGLAQTARRGAPDWPSAADTLGWAYYQKGIYDSAISQFQEALRLGEKRGDPDNADLHYHLGLAYQKKNNAVLARQQLKKAVELDPKKDDARKALSELRG